MLPDCTEAGFEVLVGLAVDAGDGGHDEGSSPEGPEGGLVAGHHVAVEQADELAHCVHDPNTGDTEERHGDDLFGPA